MKKGLLTTIVISLLAVGIHFYLTKRSYELQAGVAEKSNVCSINETLNCDTALTSPFGKIFGMPLTNWGISLNLFIAFVLIGLFFKILNLSVFWKSVTLFTSFLIGLASVVMIGVSLIAKLYCPLCWTTYVLSFFSFGILYWLFRADFSFKEILKGFKNRFNFILIGSVFAIVFFLHINFLQSYDIKNLTKTNKAIFIDWKIAKVNSFNQSHLLRKGPIDAKMKLVEFADFLCPHCKNKHKDVKRFLETHPDVSFQLYLYPLDQACNPQIKFSAGGVSCDVSKILICGVQQNKGLELLESLFEKQEEWASSKGNKDKFKKLTQEIIETNNLNEAKLTECLQDKNTTARLKQSVETGMRSKIIGTPTFYINGKLLRNGSSLSFDLQQIYNHLK